MRKIFTILLLSISFLLYGQDEKPFQYRVWVGEKQYEYLITKFVEGDVNLSNGDHVHGLINRDLTEPIITVIDTDTTIYKTDEIVDFKLKHESKVISAKVNGKYVFLQYLPTHEGPITVYTYDQIIKEERKTSGGNFFTNPIGYDRVVEIVFEKNGQYIKLCSLFDVYELIEDNKLATDYTKKLGELKLSNLNQIIHLIEFYNMSLD